MAKVETRQLPTNGKLSTVHDVVRALRGAAADELSAANLYAEILEALKAGGQKGVIQERIAEIMADEQQHLGSLLWLVGELDRTIASDMEKGAAGK